LELQSVIQLENSLVLLLELQSGQLSELTLELQSAQSLALKLVILLVR
jgi:hypothetical protein